MRKVVIPINLNKADHRRKAAILWRLTNALRSMSDWLEMEDACLKIDALAKVHADTSGATFDEINIEHNTFSAVPTSDDMSWLAMT